MTGETLRCESISKRYFLGSAIACLPITPLFQFALSSVAVLTLGAPQEAVQTTPVQILSQNAVVNADGSFNYR